jgi:hypothetical protein
MAQTLTLFPSATRVTAVSDSAGDSFDVADAKRVIVLLDLTATAGVAGDVLDVYVDVSLDGTKWLNAAHFTQLAGDAAAMSAYVILDPTTPGTAPIVTTADCASGAVRPSAWGKYIRGRYTLVDAGAHGQSVTFSLKSIVQPGALSS